MSAVGEAFPVLELDLGRHELFLAGQPVRLENLPFELFVLLVENRDIVVTRDQIVERLWGRDIFVETDKNINVAIRKIRRALGDDAEHPRVIQTIIGKGYRFIAPITVVSPRASTVDGERALCLPQIQEPLTQPSAHRLRLLAFSCTAGVALVFVSLLTLRTLMDNRAGADSTPSAAMRSLAVLPFENLSRDPQEAYFVDGMTDLLITDLAQISALRVISRSSVMQYKSVSKPVSEIGRELKIDVALEGTVVRSRDRVRITAQLVDAHSDRPIWAGKYERDLRDVLALQNEIATDIAREVRARLTPDERMRLSISRPINPAAHDAYLRGVYEWNRWEPGARKAAEYFKLATRLDPNYSLAYASLAGAYSHFGIMGILPPSQAWEDAKAAAVKALQLNDSSAEAHAALAYVKSRYDWDWAGSDAEFKRAIDLNPSYATAHHWYGLLLAEVGKFEDAISETERAEDLDPLSVLISASLGRRFYLARQFERAEAQFQKTLRMDPMFGLAFSGLGAVYIHEGRYAEAIQTLEKGASIAKANPETLPVLGFAYAVSGHRAEARSILRELQTLSRNHYVSPYFTAMIHTGLRERDLALSELEQARNDRSNWMTLVKSEPLFDGLHSDPRFQEIVRSLRYPDLESR